MGMGNGPGDDRAYVEGHTSTTGKVSSKIVIRGDSILPVHVALNVKVFAYMRLWVVPTSDLTSDPSPWNVLLTPTSAACSRRSSIYTAFTTVIPLYVFQT
jgi:hypothetical protein